MQSIIPLVCKKLGISWVVFSDLIWRDANIPRWIRKTFCYRQYLSIYTWYQLIQVHNRMKAHILRQCKEALVGWLSTFHFCALEQVCKFNQNMWKTIFNYNRLKYSPWQQRRKQGAVEIFFLKCAPNSFIVNCFWLIEEAKLQHVQFCLH